MGLVEGLQLVIARRVGERRAEEVGATFIRGLLLAAGVSVALAAGMRLAAGEISEWLVGSREVARELERFLEIAAYGLPLMAVSLCYGSLYVGMLRARVLVSATIVLVLTNLGLSYVLILGNLGFPRLEMEGAALAFVGAEAATFAFLTVRTMRDFDIPGLGRFRLRRSAGPVVRPLLRVSGPVALQALLEAARWFAFFLIVERISDDLLAWSNVIFACFLVLLIPAYAMSETAYTMVSNVVGAGQLERVRAVARRTLLTAYLVTAPLLLAAAIFPGAILSLVGAEGVPTEEGQTALRIVVAGMAIVIAAEVWMAVVLGTGDVDAALLIELALSVVIVAGAVAAAYFELSLPYLWLFVPASAALALVLAYARFRAGHWRTRNV